MTRHNIHEYGRPFYYLFIYFWYQKKIYGYQKKNYWYQKKVSFISEINGTLFLISSFFWYQKIFEILNVVVTNVNIQSKRFTQCLISWHIVAVDGLSHRRCIWIINSHKCEYIERSNHECENIERSGHKCEYTEQAVHSVFNFMTHCHSRRIESQTMYVNYKQS